MPPVISTSTALTRLKESNNHNTTDPLHKPGEIKSPSLYHDKSKRKRSNTQPSKAASFRKVYENQSTHHSSVFMMKCEHLLKEGAIDYSKLSPLESFSKRLKASIDAVKPVSVPDDLVTRYPFIKFTLPSSEEYVSRNFEFKPPTRADLVGSYLVRTVARPNLNLDMTVEMPAEMFNSKDYLNYRYFNKRSAYVAELFMQLRMMYPYSIEEEKGGHAPSQADTTKTSDASGIRPYFFLQAWQGDIYHPIIVVKCLLPTEADGPDSYVLTSWTIRIFAVPHSKVFSESRLAPWKNCVRFCTTSAVPNLVKETLQQKDHCKSHLPPTPMYNGAILEDIKMHSWLHIFAELSQRIKGFASAVQLLKMWGRRQGFCTNWSACDSSSLSEIQISDQYFVCPVNGFLLTIVCAHICISQKLQTCGATPIQIFKLVLSFLAESDFTNCKGIFGQKKLCALSNSEKELGLFLFLDATGAIPGSYNIFWQELQQKALVALTALNSIEEPYDAVFAGTPRLSPYLDYDLTFMCKQNAEPFLIKSDSIFKVSEEAEVHQNGSLLPENEKVLSIHIENSVHHNVAGGLIKVLKRGLTDRIENDHFVRYLAPKTFAKYHASHPVLSPPFSWTDISPAPLKNNLVGVFLAFRLSDVTESGDTGGLGSPIWRLVDRGVPASGPLAESFRSFWGVSAVRRFQDGAINESVVWKKPTTCLQNPGLVRVQGSDLANYNVQSVPSQIVNHLLERHFGTAFQINNRSKKSCKKKGSIIFIEAPLGVPERLLNYYLDVNGDHMPHPCTTFSALKSVVVGLTELPLNIKDFRISDLSGISRHCDPPSYSTLVMKSREELDDVPFAYAPEVFVDCVLEFGKSGGWPMDVNAIKYMKGALLIALRNSLLEQFAIRSDLGGLTLSSEIVSEPFLDIYYSQRPIRSSYLPHVVFRTRVFHPFEHLAIATQLSDSTTDMVRVFDSKICNVIEDTRALWWRPITAALISSMASKFASFASSIRLIKAWLASQQFPLEDFSDLVEFCCVFIYASGDFAPRTAHAALGKFLQLIAFHPWNSEGLFISGKVNDFTILQEVRDDLSSAFKRCQEQFLSQQAGLLAENSRNNSSFTKPLFWLASPLDPHCQFITLPNQSQSQHLIKISKLSLELFEKLSTNYEVKLKDIATDTLENCAPPSFGFLSNQLWKQSLFTTKIYTNFDLIIRLKSKISIRRSHLGQPQQTEQKKSKFKNLNRSRQSEAVVESSVKESGTVSLSDNLDEINTMSNLLEQIENKRNEDCLSSINEFVSQCQSALDISSHEMISVLRETFNILIKKFKERLIGICDFYYDSLAIPYPSQIFVKINPWSVVPTPVSPAFSNSSTKCFGDVQLIRNDVGNVIEVKAPSSIQLSEFPNIITILALLQTLGSSIIDEVAII